MAGFNLVIVALVWAAAAPAGARAQSLKGWRLREYTVDLPRSVGSAADSAADIAPDSARLALYSPGPAGDRVGSGAPDSWPMDVSFYDYHQGVLAGKAEGAQVRRVFSSGVHFFWRNLVRYGPEGRHLSVYGAGVVHLFAVTDGHARELRAIDLGLSEARPTFQPVDMQWSPDSHRIAVLLSFRIYHQGVVRVYDASLSRLQWERPFDRVEMAHGSWSPDGARLAVTLLSGAPNTAYPERDITNLLVLDANSGTILRAIKTGDQAGPVCFAPHNAVLTAPLHSHPEGHDRWHHEKVKVWDATTGRLIRQIASPGRDVHDALELSADGKVLLGYVGKEKSGFSFRALEYDEKVLDRRFQLFDYGTGAVLGTSPDLGKGCSVRWFAPSFRLGQDGRSVLVYWPSLACAPSVFEVTGTE
jgi:hypothetical protein